MMLAHLYPVLDYLYPIKCRPPSYTSSIGSLDDDMICELDLNMEIPAEIPMSCRTDEAGELSCIVLVGCVDGAIIRIGWADVHHHCMMMAGPMRCTSTDCAP